ncbi:carbohydrate-binding protein [Phytohabitans suffuscus]|uniref:Uncharacterized protein n=1 Tax=Phytohabitans suffuscus TaxID=624315 RepID=A0A6F8YTD4_9ACTN|nr:hypothetical protein Psuf_067100 [Phytohabitans suffuscus]
MAGAVGGDAPDGYFPAAVAGVSGNVQVRLDSLSNAPIGSFSLANTGGQPAGFVNVDCLVFRR